jgi:hypothetical protein
MPKIVLYQGKDPDEWRPEPYFGSAIDSDEFAASHQLSIHLREIEGPAGAAVFLIHASDLERSGIPLAIEDVENDAKWRLGLVVGPVLITTQRGLGLQSEAIFSGKSWPVFWWDTIEEIINYMKERKIESLPELFAALRNLGKPVELLPALALLCQGCLVANSAWQAREKPNQTAGASSDTEMEVDLALEKMGWTEFVKQGRPESLGLAMPAAAKDYVLNYRWWTGPFGDPTIEPNMDPSEYPAAGASSLSAEDEKRRLEWLCETELHLDEELKNAGWKGRHGEAVRRLWRNVFAGRRSPELELVASVYLEIAEALEPRG